MSRAATRSPGRYKITNRPPAAPGLCPFMAADRGPALLNRCPARRRCWYTRPYHLLAAQPRPGACRVFGASPGERTGAQGDRRHGLRVYRAGEALVAKRGERGTRTWRELHLAVGPSTGEILASELTSIEDGDAPQVGPLLDQISGLIASVTADGAYDGDLTQPFHLLRRRNLVWGCDVERSILISWRNWIRGSSPLSIMQQLCRITSYPVGPRSVLTTIPHA